MPIVENKTVARRVLEDLVTHGRFEVVDEIYAPSFELRDPTTGQTITTYEGVKDLIREMRTHTPDMSIVIEEEIADADAVVHRWTAHGHNALTGKSMTVPGISVYHLDGGRIVSEYVIPDRLGMLRQLGLVPTPGQAQG